MEEIGRNTVSIRTLKEEKSFVKGKSNALVMGGILIIIVTPSFIADATEALEKSPELFDFSIRNNIINSLKQFGEGGERWMPGIRIKENESFENALRRFKKQVEKTGILSEIRKREHYEKPSIKRKKKALAAKKRAMKRMRKIMDRG